MIIGALLRITALLVLVALPACASSQQSFVRVERASLDNLSVCQNEGVSLGVCHAHVATQRRICAASRVDNPEVKDTLACVMLRAAEITYARRFCAESEVSECKAACDTGATPMTCWYLGRSLSASDEDRARDRTFLRTADGWMPDDRLPYDKEASIEFLKKGCAWKNAESCQMLHEMRARD